jgi:hypothetical protein
MATNLELRNRSNPTYRVKQIFLGLYFGLFLISCNSHPPTTAVKDSLVTHPLDSSQQNIAYVRGTLTIAPALLKKYQKAFLHDTASYDKRFVANFIDIVRKFNCNKLDTTILTIGNLAGDLVPDTIFSRVYYEADSIFVDSRWIKNNRVLWRDKYSDPYTSLDVNLFSDTSRNTWMCFAIGIIYGPPDILPRGDVDTSALSMVYQQGVDDLKRLGVQTDREQYRVYLQDFKGQLLAFGQPESREGVWIWYKPAGRMITYYQP